MAFLIVSTLLSLWPPSSLACQPPLTSLGTHCNKYRTTPSISEPSNVQVNSANVAELCSVCQDLREASNPSLSEDGGVNNHDIYELLQHAPHKQNLVNDIQRKECGITNSTMSKALFTDRSKYSVAPKVCIIEINGYHQLIVSD